MTDSFQRIQIYGKPDANGNIIPVANIFASQTGNIVSYIPGENIEFVVDQTTGNIHINAPSYKPMADYWRTFRNFETNASIIATRASMLFVTLKFCSRTQALIAGGTLLVQEPSLLLAQVPSVEPRAMVTGVIAATFRKISPMPEL